MWRCKFRGCVLAVVGLLSGTVAAQAITEFSDGITPGAHPLGITAGPDGNLWFTEQGADRIGKITTSGVATEFSEGITPGSQPSQITVGSDGNLWFTESGGSRIGRITPQGVITELATTTGISFIGFGIAAGSDGNVWFTQKALAGSIGRITPAGIVTKFGPHGTNMPDQITAGPDGNLWFTETQLGSPAPVNFGFKIVRISPDGAFLPVGPQSGFMESPGGITVGPDSNLWFTRTVPSLTPPLDSPGLWIDKMTLDGVRTSYFTGSPVPSRPDPGITLGPDGSLWFTGDNQIGRITPDGTIALFSLSNQGSPVRITAGPDGNLWFTEYDGDRIGRITTIPSVVEFYNASLDHYFITWAPDEIAKLDAGTEIKGWTRTGYSFKAYTSAVSGESQVCRYYIPPQLGDSHFFGRGADECSSTAQKNPSFVLEAPNFMQMYLPTAGTCPDSTTPVYRVFSNRADANHRYMTDRALRDEMVAKGWLAEGDGPDLVVMCAPQ